MRTNILLICALFLSGTVKSQDPASPGTTSGKITFQEKIKLEIKLEGDAAQFADQLPKEQVNSKVLYFNPENSLYLADNSMKEEEDLDQHDGVMKIRMVNGGESDKIFCDLRNRKKTEQREFMTRMFLIEGDLAPSQWKFTGNSQTILGFNCQEAVSDDTTRKIKAWFTASIPVSTGPAGFGSLPGMILQIDINDGKRIITASAIDRAFNDQGAIVRPKDGKRVTAEEFKKIVDEKMKEMGAENGEGGNHIIIRYRNN